VYQVLEDHRQRLWLSTNRGIGVVAIAHIDSYASGLVDRLGGAVFGTADGMRNAEGNGANQSAGCITSVGQVWFPTVRGVVMIDPAMVDLESPPTPTVEDVTVAGTSLGMVRNAHLASDQHSVEISFSELGFRSPRRSLFRYRLDGLGKDWTVTERRREAFYPFVPPGSYRFLVAVSFDGVRWSEPAVVGLHVAAPFWQTLWFRSLAALLVVTLGWRAHRLRLTAIESRERQLEEQVTERTAEVTSKNQQLELVNAAVRAINRKLELPDLLQAILDEVSPLVGADWALALVRDDRSQMLELGASYGPEGSHASAPRLSESELREELLDGCLEIGPGVHIGPSARSPLRPTEEQLGGAARSMMAVRVDLEGRLVGYLLYARTGERPFSTERSEHLSNLNEHVVSAFTKGRLLAQLRDLNTRKDEFLGMAAHDLRSPLAFVQSATELLEKKASDGEIDRALLGRFLGHIRDTVVQMQALINDLLDVAAIEQGRIQIQVEPVRVSDLLADRRPVYASQAKDKDISLVIDVRDSDTIVYADRDRVVEVLDNLVSNAFKFSHSGGRVRVFCESDGHALLTHVEDTGQGIPESELPQVFSGTKLSPSPTGGETSTGFGLVIVKKLVELHGGRVWVDSEHGVGATFSFSLPKCSPA